MAKLTGMNVLVSAAALLLACAAFAGYDLLTFRQAIVQKLSIQAEIVGFNSASAVLFNDPNSAETTLAALKAAPDIVEAAIYTLPGQPFAGYWRHRKGRMLPLPKLPQGASEVHWFTSGQLVLVRRIVFEGQPADIVLIRSDLLEIDRRLKQYVKIVAAVLAASLFAALSISFVLQRAIANPIVHLAEIAKAISRDKNYAVRATPTGNRDELAVLIGAFNEMLAQIEARDEALQCAHDKLEQRVEERTAQLNAANKELEAFSYSVSHDLRAPLRQINGFSKILVDEYGPQLDPGARRYLNLVQDGAKNMGQLVDDLLDMGKISRKELASKPTDLNPLVQSALWDLQPECEGREIDWRIRSLPTLDCDPGLMKQVFANLLSNAVKYTRRRRPAVIEVGEMQEGGAPVIFVRDNGVGFDQRYAHKLFGVFQRLHRAEDFEGTGVGLATVQRILQKHGGRIWAEAEVDKGATFFFTLRATRGNAPTTADRT